MLPPFEVVGRQRPVRLVAATSTVVNEAWPRDAPRESSYDLRSLAPYVAVEADLGPRTDAGRIVLTITGADGTRLSGGYDAALGAGLDVTVDGRTTTHRSRRHGRPGSPPETLGLTLTGTRLSVLTREAGAWTVRGLVDLTGRVDTRAESWLATLRTDHRWEGVGPAPLRGLRAGGFGQLGLRDLRLVTSADGAPYISDGRVLLTATSAGPGFFDTAHTSVWSLDPDSLELEHRADLYFRRPDRDGVFGDHATHLVRDDDRWLVATSTWGDFDRGRPGATVGVTLAESTADLLEGTHVLDPRPLALPTTGLTSVGVWDPHLVRDGDRWLVGFVSARAFFDFHPAVAQGPDLDRLSLRAAATDRHATEGTTIVQLDGVWRVLASAGSDERPDLRRQHPVFDLDLRPVGALDAPYPSNIAWPTIVPHGGGWLLVMFDGTAYGGPLPGYGTHGDVVLARDVARGVARTVARNVD